MSDLLHIEHISHIISINKSVADVLKSLNRSDNGKNRKLIKDYIQLHNIDISHFYKCGEKNRKNPLVEKICPICNNIFTTSTPKGKKEKITCSTSCANTYFRSGSDNPNWKDDSYRSTCFKYHAKECVVCKESNIVAVHHLDHNHDNNIPENLIPLCPTHHQYWHSNFRPMIEPIIRTYIDEFKTKFATLMQY